MFGITGAIENAVQVEALKDWIFADDEQILFRPPDPRDAAAIHALVLESKPLEPNSLYAYLLLCRDFASTCVVAEHHHEVVGFVAAYRRPEQKNTLFVWQVAVKRNMRGRSLAKSMTLAILSRQASHGISCIEATVSPSNTASQALFRGLARALSAECREEPLFEADHFGGHQHEEEVLFCIEPFGWRAVKRAESTFNSLKKETSA